MKQKKMGAFRLYWRYIHINLLAGFQYKGWPLKVVQVFLLVLTDPLAMVLLFSRFGSIGEWSMERMLLIYSMAITSFGMAETFCRGYDLFPHNAVQSGAFDRVLLRPRSTFIQVIADQFHIHRIARVCGGLACCFFCLWRMGVPLASWRILLFFYALLGGLILYCGVMVFTSGLSFFTVKGLDWIYLFTNVSYQVLRCPKEYLPAILRRIFTFLIPVLVISYYPASVLCGWGEPFWKGLLALPVGLAFLGGALIVWRIGIRHYGGTGS